MDHHGITVFNIYDDPKRKMPKLGRSKRNISEQVGLGLDMTLAMPVSRSSSFLVKIIVLMLVSGCVPRSERIGTFLSKSSETRCISEDTSVTCSGYGTLTKSHVRDGGLYTLYVHAVIESGITVIDQGAFKSCTALETVSFPESLTTISDESFGECTSLKSVTLPSSLTSMSSMVFNDCSQLVDIHMSSNSGTYQEINGMIKSGTTLVVVGPGRGSGSTLTLPNVKELGDTCCRWNQARIIIIPEGVEVITNAFRMCRYLEEISIPSTVSSITLGTFEGCESLVTINLNAKNEYIYLSTTVNGTTFGQRAGRKSDGGRPSSVVWISPKSLYVIFDNGVSGIGTTATQLCPLLKAVTIIEGSPYLKVSESGELVLAKSGDSFCVAKYCLGSVVDLVVGTDVTHIGPNCCYSCKLLQTVKLHSNIQSIGSSAFRECHALKSIDFNNCFSSQAYAIDVMIFENCSQLTQILNWPTQPHEITTCMFRQTGFTSLDIPESVTKVCDRGFLECYSLENVRISTNVKQIETDAFLLCTKLKTVTFKYGSTLTTIDSLAFGDCKSLVSITLPDSLSSLDTRAFIGSNIATVRFQGGGTGTYRSSDVVYQKLSDNRYHTVVLAPPMLSGHVTFKEGVQVIEKFAFFRCEKVTSITMGNTIKSIGGSAFFLSKCLEKLRFGGSLTEFGTYAFHGTNIKEIFFCGGSAASLVYAGDPFPTNPTIYVFVDVPENMFCGHEAIRIYSDTCSIPTASFTCSYMRHIKRTKIYVAKLLYTVTGY